VAVEEEGGLVICQGGGGSFWDMRKEKGHTGVTNIVSVDSALAVEVLLSLLGDLVDVGVLVFGRHVDICVCSLSSQ
jgi:carbamate kinase